MGNTTYNKIIVTGDYKVINQLKDDLKYDPYNTDFIVRAGYVYEDSNEYNKLYASINLNYWEVEFSSRYTPSECFVEYLSFKYKDLTLMHIYQNAYTCYDGTQIYHNGKRVFEENTHWDLDENMNIDNEIGEIADSYTLDDPDVEFFVSKNPPPEVRDLLLLTP